MWFKKIIAVLLTVMFLNSAIAKEKDLSKLENTIYIDLPHGRVVVELMPEVAPKHVNRIKDLAREEFYDNVVFHRVIDGFMAQTGDPTGTGRGGSDKPDLEAEFSNVPHERGVVSMARATSPNSANSQFFIMFEENNSLDGNYTVFGKVVSGMEHVDSIKKGDSRRNGMVENPTVMLKVRVAADVESN